MQLRRRSYLNQHFSSIFSTTTLILVLPMFGRSANAQSPDNYWEAEDTVKERFVVHKLSVGCRVQVGKHDTGIDYSIEYPIFSDSSSPLHDSLAKFVRSQLEGIDSMQGIPDWLLARARSQFIFWDKNIADAPLGSGEEYNIRIATDTCGVVGICSSWWTPGGAHPSSSAKFVNLDAASGKTLKLSDLLLPDYKRMLDSVGEVEFRLVHKMQPTESMADKWEFKDNKFSLNDNFLIKTDGLEFVFNDYEVSSYANPAGGLTLSYYSIRDIIRKDGPLAAFFPKDQ